MTKILKANKCPCGSMPVIFVRNCIDYIQEFGCKCPICGRGGKTTIPTSFSAYKAIKHWNELFEDKEGEE